MDNELLDGFHLRDIRIEPLTGTVRKPDGEAHLPSRSVEVLLCLAKNPRRLIPREEILEKVWGDSQGSSEALSHAIGDIRQALGDRADDPTFVQTVPRRGYRLLAEPRPIHDEPRRRKTDVVAPPFWEALIRHGVVQALIAYLAIGWLALQFADTTFANLNLPAWSGKFLTFAYIGGIPIVILLSWFLEIAEGRIVDDKGQHRGSLLAGLGRNYLAIVAAYVVAGVGAGVYQLLVGFEGPTVSTPIVAAEPEPDIDEVIPVRDNSVAVLRFANLDGSETTELFSAGLSEDILDRVARVPGLLVPARGDSWSLPLNATSDEVRNRLRVAYYLEGSVRMVDEKIIVVAQLIVSGDGFHLVSRTFEKEEARFSDLQREIADLVVAQLKVAMPSDVQRTAVYENDDANIDAYVEFRRGRDALDQPRRAETLAAAAEHFGNALQIDPEYAAAHAGLCVTYLERYRLEGDNSYIDDAEQACGAAVMTSPRLPAVHSATASLYLLTGRIAEAEAAYDAALELDPRNARAMLGLRRVYLRQQRYEEAEAVISRSIDIQPGNWKALNDLGELQFALGRYDDAAESFKKALYLNADNFVAIGNMGTSYMLAGKFEESIRAYKWSLSIEDDPTMLSNLGVLYYYLGEFDTSVEYHRRSVEATPKVTAAWANLGDSLTFLGRKKEAEEAYSKALALARERYTRDSTDAENLTYLAWAETMVGDPEEGLIFARRATELAPDDPYSLYYLGLVQLQAGDIEAATDAIESAIEIGYPKSLIAAEPYLEPLRKKKSTARLE